MDPTALGSVGDDDVGTFADYRNEFESFVAWIKWGRGLRCHHGKDLDALHVLLDVRTIDVADYWPARNERRLQDALGKLCSRRAPRCQLAIQTGYFDLNASRHRVLI
jgi:hypothetical protein